MKLPLLFVIVAVCAVMSSLAVNAAPLATVSAVVSGAETDAVEVRGVIETMNRSVSERNLPGILKTFAEGSVKVDLFPAHKYGAAAEPESDIVKTVTLNKRWQAVAPILFATTKVYKRKIDVVDLHIDKGMAVAWLDVETETLSVKEGATTKFNRFKEICILRRYDDGWKIVTVTNNRHDPT